MTPILSKRTKRKFMNVCNCSYCDDTSVDFLITDDASGFFVDTRLYRFHLLLHVSVSYMHMSGSGGTSPSHFDVPPYNDIFHSNFCTA